MILNISEVMDIIRARFNSRQAIGDKKSIDFVPFALKTDCIIENDHCGRNKLE